MNFRLLRQFLVACGPRFTTRCYSSAAVPLHFEDLTAHSSHKNETPVVISHGMLGSCSNWSSVAKTINKETGRRVVCLDARNHGQSPHREEMTYQVMGEDLVSLVKNSLGVEKATLIGHSMGGRTSMWTALNWSELVDRLVVVDISPVNQSFDTMDSTEWNMSHYFHAMSAVSFLQGKGLASARQDAMKQLGKRIADQNLRAWLLMNMTEDDETKEIRWRINIDNIHNAFKRNIAFFPEGHDLSYEGPTLFIGGADSDYIPVADHEEISEVFPQSKVTYVEGAGHWVHAAKPKEFLEILLPFLKEP